MEFRDRQCTTLHCVRRETQMWRSLTVSGRARTRIENVRQPLPQKICAPVSLLVSTVLGLGASLQGFGRGEKTFLGGGRFLFINFLRTQQNLGERQKFGGTAPECVTTGLHTTPFQFGTAIKKLRMTCCGDSERGEASGAPRSAMGVDEDCSVPPDSVPREVISQIGLSFNALLQRHQSQVCIFLLPQGNWELMTVASTPLNYFLGKITKTFAFAGEG